MHALIPPLRLMITPNIHKPQGSGATLPYSAEKERATSGLYYEGIKQIKSSIGNSDEAMQEDLWAWKVKTLAADDQERRRFDIVA
ncbi:hypothetical protein G647_05681 [Cladophialophora carrionii CBS 160.54]|uniref:Uncharacterized protein n=1 Tax=Cladophialophora carrionii CBS 160.54 TaxID=1279043 RepID=V9DAG1_9EURO|nr:uncharacterized protein G647_05681 [Cladophialophora carrionii CBS 160.54]ETI23874.1 hypothetical protein G647_05681 [Cladophialophora carrionii CBS 160.54]